MLMLSASRVYDSILSESPDRIGALVIVDSLTIFIVQLSINSRSVNSKFRLLTWRMMVF